MAFPSTEEERISNEGQTLSTAGTNLIHLLATHIQRLDNLIHHRDKKGSGNKSTA
ncbi:MULTISPECIES: hypothetical protein [Prevotella]|uniref:hypothetical protein n=1 Tax=Prevotella TaxID=838 RepID=UPI0013154F24|nr:hypothetical protein [Prevotella brunnea]